MFKKLRSKGISGAVGALVLAGMLPLTTASCIGSFELTRKVYRFNLDLDDDKWVRWVGFLAMNIVPVYSFAVLIDAVFANSAEFWTGDNPVLSGIDGQGEVRVAHGPGGETVRATRVAPGVVDLELTDATGHTRRMRVVSEGATLAAYDTSGVLLARVADVDGRPALLTR